MSKDQCYLCAKPGKFEKLFRKCKHESACHDCLRDRYVIKAPQCISNSSSAYECFHPDCNLEVREVQMKGLVRSTKEIQNYVNAAMQPKTQHYNARKHSEIQRAQTEMEAKIQSFNKMKDEEMQRARFGPNWQHIVEALEGLLSMISRCPKCHILMTKDGGCDHMTCIICGAEFNWNDSRLRIQKFCEQIEKRNKHAIDNLHARTEASCVDIERRYNRLIQNLHTSMIARTTTTSRVLETAAHQPKISAKRAPLLAMDDDSIIEDSSEDYSVEDSPDFYADEDEASPDCTTSVHLTTSDLDSVPSDFDICSFPSISQVVASAGVESEQDFHVLEIASDASDDSWTQFDAESESSIITDSDFQTTSSQTTWEEVSEVSSVVSFHSKTGMSFLEAARAKASNQPVAQNRWKEVSKTPKPTLRLQTIAEHRKPMVSEQASDDDDHVGEMFDADFMYDGAKYSRGACVTQKARKLKKLFRKCKHVRCMDSMFDDELWMCGEMHETNDDERLKRDDVKKNSEKDAACNGACWSVKSTIKD